MRVTFWAMTGTVVDATPCDDCGTADPDAGVKRRPDGEPRCGACHYNIWMEARR